MIDGRGLVMEKVMVVFGVKEGIRGAMMDGTGLVEKVIVVVGVEEGRDNEVWLSVAVWSGISIMESLEEDIWEAFSFNLETVGGRVGVPWQ